MNQALVVSFTTKAVMLVLLLSMPPIIAASVIGVGISLIQAMTQVQEQTIGTAVKLIVVTVVLLFSSSWLGGELYNYALYLFDEFPMLVR